MGGGGTADAAGDADTAATHQGDHHLATQQHQDIIGQEGPLASHNSLGLGPFGGFSDLIRTQVKSKGGGSQGIL